MSLHVWLPLNGNLLPSGLDNITLQSNTGAVVADNGKIGKCYSFDGTNDWIYYNNFNKNFYGGKPLTLALWFKSDKVKSQGTLIDIAADLSTGYRYDSSTNTVRFTYWRVYKNSQGGRTGDTQTAATTYDADKWHHVVAVIDKTKNYLYVDGNLAGQWSSVSQEYWVPLLGSTYYAFGFAKSSGSSYWSGGLANDIRFYDHALSPKEIKELAKGLALHLKLDNNSFGETNVIPDSVYLSDPWKTAIADEFELDGKWAKTTWINTLYNKTSSGADNIFPGVTYEANTQYTISLDWRDDYRSSGSTNMYIQFRYTDGTTTYMISGDLTGKHYWTHRSLTSTAGKTVSKITTTYGSGSAMYLANIKLEKGTTDTGYAPPDGYQACDCSGYNHAVVCNNITVGADSPRYSKCAVFNGSSSYIKIDDNDWMAQYAEEMTINVWVYSSNWANATSGNIFSCTEGGGWNLEAGDTGYALFAVNAATNADRSTHAYLHNTYTALRKGFYFAGLSAGWHMLTMVYTTSAILHYIDGQLHKSVSATSYGIFYNLSSSKLFLGCEAGGTSPTSPYFNGKMSDFRLYYTALSATDIAELYNNVASADRNGTLCVREAVEI